MNSFATNRNEIGKAVDFLQLFKIAYLMQNDARIFPPLTAVHVFFLRNIG